MTLNRRLLCAALAGLASGSPWIARADAPPPPPTPTDWSGEKDGVMAHVLVYDGEVRVFRWRNTSLSPSNSRPSPNDRGYTFSFPGGRATLTVTGPQTARITIVDAKGEVSLDLRRD
jgi:hypothetical protein